MTTIKDIAKKAGVSHGTVSNVLNKRGNVSVKKIKMVEEAAHALGYNLNRKAHTLRSGTNHAVSLILPSLEQTEYVQFYEGVKKSLREQGYSVHLYITYDLPHYEEKILEEIAAERVTGVLAVSCLDDARTYYEKLHIPEDHVVFINRQVRNSRASVSFDFTEAGRDIAAYILDQGFESVGLFTGEEKHSNERSFTDVLARDLSFLPTRIERTTLQQAHSAAFSFFKDQSFDVLVTSSPNFADHLRKAHTFGSLHPMPALITLDPSTRGAGADTVSYLQNYQLLGKKTAGWLLDHVHDVKTMEPHVILSNKGFVDTEVTASTNGSDTIKLLTLPSPTTDALQKILPHFQKQTGIRVEVDVQSFDQMYEELMSKSQERDHDLIRLDMAWLPWLGEELFTPLQGLDGEIDDRLASLPKYLKRNYSEVNGQALVLPFDPSLQMLFYRKDLFEDPKIKRMFYETYKKQLTIPEDFESMNEIVHFFSRAAYSDSPIEYGTGMILGKPSIMALDFLARYYERGGRLVQENHLMLDPAKAEAALENYLETVKMAKPFLNQWWTEEVSSFARGEMAMIIGFINHASKISLSEVGPLVGSALPPGGSPILGGGVIGLSKQSRKTHAALTFLKWIHEDAVAEQITMLGGTTAKLEVCDNQTIHSLYPWLSNSYDTKFKGIREKQFKDGSYFNTKAVEEIIGTSLQRSLSQKHAVSDIIAEINAKLENYADTFVRS
ncbi:extracellular solute-binding protein [Halobacillus kuroshimensis]|uniref:Extracellular solute-binding protein n=1 Tax=Halobacillus kuroshimensis TaxID=302481 RepID=A0ABS3DYH2_9BACI|nr:extracellular solute-binding protein [Halobacillus kuroshimensis]